MSELEGYCHIRNEIWLVEGSCRIAHELVIVGPNGPTQKHRQHHEAELWEERQLVKNNLTAGIMQPPTPSKSPRSLYPVSSKSTGGMMSPKWQISLGPLQLSQFPLPEHHPRMKTVHCAILHPPIFECHFNSTMKAV